MDRATSDNTPTQQSPGRSRRRIGRMIAAAVAAVVILVGGGAATMAGLSDSAQGASGAKGKYIDLKIGESDTFEDLMVSDPLAPGEQGTVTLTVYNQGNADGALYISLADASCTEPKVGPQATPEQAGNDLMFQFGSAGELKSVTDHGTADLYVMRVDANQRPDITVTIKISPDAGNEVGNATCTAKVTAKLLSVSAP